MLAQFKVREKPYSRRPIADRPKDRSDGDASYCLGVGERGNRPISSCINLT